jgi:16S rRNA (uracil1498-N3)-methyltransferase
MDIVVQKATELGVHRITPVITEYSVVRLDPKRTEKRVQHWRGIGASACEQSGRNVLPQIDPPQALRSWLGDNFERPGTRLIMKPGAKGSMKSIDGNVQQLILLIGPEGGFSNSEYELADATGFSAIGFGARILRTETAAVAAIAALQTLFGDLVTD